MENEIYDIIRGVNTHSVEEALRDFLNQSKIKHVTDVTFADALLLFTGRGKHWVYDAGIMYECEIDGNALYQRLYDEDIANIVHNLELSPIDQGEGLFKASATRTNNIIRVIKNRSHNPGYFADAPQGIALQNGFLRIEDKEVKHDKPLTIDHRQRHALHVAYNPDANAAAIDDFLFSVLKDQALVSFIYELFGIAVFGVGGSYHKFVIFYGSGRNGKGAVSRLLRKLLNITGNVYQPDISGKLSSLRGRYEEFGRKFDISHAVLQFQGTMPPSPYLDILATTQAEDIEASVFISGRAEHPKISLESVPALPEDEILSRILFGTNSGKISPFQALRLAQTLRRLSGHSTGFEFDPLGAVRSVTGLDDIQVEGLGTDRATVGAGKYISDKIYVEIEQGATENSSAASVEVEVTPNISVESKAGRDGSTGAGIFWEWDY